MKKVVLFLLLIFLSHFGYSQTVYSIKSDLQKLKNTATVLYIAAHPDDENNLLIGYLAKGKHYRTIYFSLTRGDGGQNLIGSEQGIELGMLRTQELLKARSVDDGEQYFSHAYDFGFSKSAEETFEHWDEGALLIDLVQSIRITQPDVIVCRFPADKRAGHGHHIASAMLAKTAYTLAGDENYKIYLYHDLNPLKSNELINLKPWKSNALLWNTFGKNDSTITDSLIKVSIAGIDSSTGKTFQELAADSRSMHKCQGFGVAPDNNSTTEYFQIIEKGIPNSNFDLNNLTNQKWNQESEGKSILKNIDDLIYNGSKYSFETTMNKLFVIRRQIKNCKDENLRKEKLSQIEKLIQDYSQLRITAFSKEEAYNINENIPYKLSVFNPQPNTTFQLLINHNLIPVTPLQNFNQEFKVLPNQTSQPFYLNKPIQKDLYSFNSNSLIKGGNDISINCPIQFIWKDDTINWQIPVQYQFVNPKSGEEIRNLIISDGVYSSAVESSLCFLSNEVKSIAIKIFNPYDSIYQCKIRPVFSNDGFRTTQKEITINFSKKGEAKSITFELNKNISSNYNTTDLSFIISDSNHNYNLTELREIEYPHIDKQHYFNPVSIKLINPSYKIATKKVAYLMGSGDKIPDVLLNLGISVDIFKENDLSKIDFSQYKVIIAGVRLYNTSKEIHRMHNALNEFIYNGGKYIVQYNTNKENEIGPYPFKVGKNRVTEENSIVTITDSTCIELNYPNKITSADFNNWIQERGIYFVENADKNFIQPLSMYDRREDSHTGSLIIGNFGKGKFVYTGISFFRQLPAHVEGATKLFLNLIAE
jgi:LmbE family N-acetylglucosaminyl deacetylase